MIPSQLLFYTYVFLLENISSSSLGLIILKMEGKIKNTIIIGPDDPSAHDYTVILLHGYGCSGWDFVSVPYYLQVILNDN